MKSTIGLNTLVFLVALVPSIALANPLVTEAWQDILDLEFDGAKVVYDESVGLSLPAQVDEAYSVPMVIDMRNADFEVAEIALFVENNPFPQVARIYPAQPIHAIGFNIRLDQTTPVRVAAMDQDGVWHVTHREVLVNLPGGCQVAPPRSYLSIGEVAMRQFVRPDGVSRLKLKIGHPMHTGLATNQSTGEVIPAHYIDQMTIGGHEGDLATMTLWASVAADPAFVFDLPEKQRSIRVNADDTNGDAFATEARPTTVPRGFRADEVPSRNAM